MKLTPAYIASQVLTCAFDYDGTLTTCTITTKAGFKLVGTSSCLDPANYSRETGEQIAHKNALDQLWPLEGYFFQKLGLAQRDADPSKVYIGSSSGDDSICVYVMPKEPATVNVSSLFLERDALKDALGKTPEFGKDIMRAVLASRDKMGFPSMADGGFVGGKRDGAE